MGSSKLDFPRRANACGNAPAAVARFQARDETTIRCDCSEAFIPDQGCQFISVAFTGALKINGIRISMDGKGRWLDTVFVEWPWA